ncbi:hypothetical protein CEXT_137661 [Caerostris extrusa]|uniref:Uncharacterized protein n=1 Tax=Caerostris extrusa TaxID=172846 RepID=A0AAV4UGT8_CAEEX|nr:hypothetical protein CEXT_137661 [Caerostris extrusa]
MPAVADDDSTSLDEKMMAAEKVNDSSTSCANQQRKWDSCKLGKDDSSRNDHCIKLKCHFLLEAGRIFS